MNAISSIPSSAFVSRRQAFAESMEEGAVALFCAPPTTLRNGDVEHDFRQSSDFYYLTGLDEPETILLMCKRDGVLSTCLWLRERDPSREVWDGPRLGVDAAPQRLSVDEALAVGTFDAELPTRLRNARTLHCRLGVDRSFDDRVFASVETTRKRAREGILFPTRFVDPGEVLHEMRLRKTPQEVATMARAAEITAEAHQAAMRVAKPGCYEFEVEAEILKVFRAQGCERVAYGSIVASGRNATILHHRRNDRKMEEGELLLIDAGAEFAFYAADVTRTFPIGGRFSTEQRAIYDLVLKAEKTCIEAVEPGTTLVSIHEIAVRVITSGLIDLGICEGPLEGAISSEAYKPYFMHRTSHWLGMDVHDVGLYHQEGQSRPLESGFVLTVEPGVYIASDADVEERWRGIGVRIEDDILVTETGYRNLTGSIPKEADELEAFLVARS